MLLLVTWRVIVLPPGADLEAGDADSCGMIPETRPTHPILTVLPAAILAILCGIELAASMVLNHGSIVYTLDDAYIHLSLAENIARGHYGINAAEPCSPSSSILWPFLLAPFARHPSGLFVPLLLNLLASVGTVTLVGTFVADEIRNADERARPIGVCMLTVAIVLATNTVGLVFTGMEHSLQVLLSVGLVAGLVREKRHDHVPWWLGACLILGPLVRYENLALSVPALFYLLWRGRRRLVVLSGAALVLTVGGFSLFLHGQGLAWIPASVILKSHAFGTGWIPSGLARAVYANLTGSPHLLIATIVVILSTCLLRRKDEGRPLAIWALSAAALHLLFGQHGWFSRYEIYILMTLLLMTIHLCREATILLLEQSPVRFGAIVAASILMLGGDYLYPLVRTPNASNNVYEQQYQLHRFVTGYYAGPVAVNDIGYVSYKNDSYVLDLFGLASREAFESRTAGKGCEWLNVLAHKHGVRLAMIYASWFPHRPANWKPVAEMSLSRSNTTVDDRVVTFFALDPETARSVAPLLARFRDSLPHGVRLALEVESPPGGAQENAG